MKNYKNKNVCLGTKIELLKVQIESINRRNRSKNIEA